jgi:DNA processing protein
VLGAPARALRAAGLSDTVVRALHQPAGPALARAEAWLARPGHRLITWQDPVYPALLKEIADPPVVLFVHGNSDLLAQPQLGIVGSRNASPAGLDNAREFAAELGRAGFCITSGLARGVDAAAHAAALQAGANTVAVCGNGPDIIYPKVNSRLAGCISAAGAVVTEFAPGIRPRAAHFPRRNRLISGLSLGVLVIEAGLRSGALITARLAATQGREVFAVPGSVRNPVARGCHRLLRDGATLVEEPADIVRELGSLLGHCALTIEQNAGRAAPAALSSLEPEASRVLEQMGWEPVSLDQLMRWCGLTTAGLCPMLLKLELAGRVIALGDGRFQRREEGRHNERNRA